MILLFSSQIFQKEEEERIYKLRDILWRCTNLDSQLYLDKDEVLWCFVTNIFFIPSYMIKYSKPLIIILFIKRFKNNRLFNVAVFYCSPASLCASFWRNVTSTEISQISSRPIEPEVTDLVGIFKSFLQPPPHYSNKLKSSTVM